MQLWTKQRLPVYVKTTHAKLEGTEPLVAVWIGSSLEVDKRDYVPDIKGYYERVSMMLPRYVIVDTETKLYDDSVYAMENFIRKRGSWAQIIF